MGLLKEILTLLAPQIIKRPASASFSTPPPKRASVASAPPAPEEPTAPTLWSALLQLTDSTTTPSLPPTPHLPQSPPPPEETESFEIELLRQGSLLEATRATSAAVTPLVGQLGEGGGDLTAASNEATRPRAMRREEEEEGGIGPKTLFLTTPKRIEAKEDESSLRFNAPPVSYQMYASFDTWCYL